MDLYRVERASTKRRLGPRSLALGVALGLGVLVGGVAAYRAASTDAQSDRAAVQATVIGAINALQQATVVATAGQTAKDVTADDLQQRSLEIPDRLATFFTGEPLTRFAELLTSAVLAQGNGPTRDVAGGTKQVEFTTLEVSADTADVTARSLDWVQRASIDGGRPDDEVAAWWDYTVHLTRTPGGWRVDRISFEPEPGFGAGGPRDQALVSASPRTLT